MLLDVCRIHVQLQCDNHDQMIRSHNGNWSLQIQMRTLLRVVDETLVKAMVSHPLERRKDLSPIQNSHWVWKSLHLEEWFQILLLEWP